MSPQFFLKFLNFKRSQALCRLETCKGTNIPSLLHRHHVRFQLWSIKNVLKQESFKILWPGLLKLRTAKELPSSNWMSDCASCWLRLSSKVKALVVDSTGLLGVLKNRKIFFRHDFLFSQYAFMGPPPINQNSNFAINQSSSTANESLKSNAYIHCRK